MSNQKGEAQMALITHIDVEVRPSIGFQTVGYTARVQFDTPIEAVEALSRVADVRDMLTEQAHTDIDALVARRQSSETEQRAQAPQPSMAPVAPSSDGWAVAQKPQGKGQYRYVTTSHYPTDRFKADALALVAEAGVNVEHVDVWDDRTGKFGLESGNESYTAGKVKAKDGTPLAQALQGKSIVGGIEFNNDGTLKFSLSRDGKSAVQALAIAGNLKQLDAAPF
jgi:hypothetical protein